MITISARLSFILLFFLSSNFNIRCPCQAVAAAAEVESTEKLYRRTVQRWHKNLQSYKPWDEYTDELLARWTSTSTSTERLQIIGGFEEGILAIEKATIAKGEGTNVQRDQALSQLYTAYGKVLFETTALECHNLALDPHTMLIGIESISQNDEPSTFLCIENAENALRMAIVLDATNTNAEEWLEKVLGKGNNDGGVSVHKRKPKEFVAELFDSFADTFDEKLVKNLKYQVPQLVGDAARSLLLSHISGGSTTGYYTSVLDAGCGTGLAGRYLRPLIVNNDGGIMIGVDASQKMIDIAAKCTTHRGCGLGEEDSNNARVDDDVKEHALYDNLLVLDLEEMTVQNTLGTIEGANSNKQDATTHPSTFDLIVAADVLVYFGSLSSLLQTFATLSTKGNAGLIFTCERATEEEAPLGYRLLQSGRFSHTRQHVVEAATNAGYTLVQYEEIVPRMERGEEVQGHLFTFVLKNDDDGKTTSSNHNEL